MQRLIVFAALAVAVQSVDQKLLNEFTEKITEIGVRCAQETNSNNDDIAALVGHKIPQTKEGKCMISCVYKAFKLQNDDGSLNPNGIDDWMERLEESDADVYGKLKQVIDECLKADNVLPDHCETSVKVASCAMETAEKVGLKTEFMNI